MSATFAADEPYRIERSDRDLVLIRFAPYCDHRRDSKYEDQLNNAVAKCSRIVCVLSETRHMSSEWIRFLAGLTMDVRDKGGLLLTVGMRPLLVECADLLGLSGKLDRVDTLDEALKR